MFSFMRRRLTWANVAMTLALVFAMGGGAYAAKKGWIITSTKQIKPSVLKQLQGKPGHPGPEGKQGVAGANGKDGVPGQPGKDGTNGTNGTNGANGTSATTEAFAGKAHGCEEGGVIVKSASPETVVCNGKAGKNGTTGFTDTLPSGKTEKGAWTVSVSKEAAGEEFVISSISFPIPLAEALPATAVHYVGPGHSDPECTGTASEPKATAGNLCVYQSAAFGMKSITNTETTETIIFQPGTTFSEFFFEGKGHGAGTSGAVIFLEPEGTVAHAAWGSWAVTAE